MAKARMGRRRIFTEPVGDRVQGVLTEPGARAFQQARVRLRLLTGWRGPISDADVIDYLARGDAESWRVLGLSGT